MATPPPRWPPGFRFSPTDEELVLYFLKRRIAAAPPPPPPPPPKIFSFGRFPPDIFPVSEVLGSLTYARNIFKEVSPHPDLQACTKITSLKSRTSKFSNDICFVIYTLYYVGQIYNLGIRAGPINRYRR
jgi:hypothetical protein